jgi:hypothetical protein
LALLLPLPLVVVGLLNSLVVVVRLGLGLLLLSYELHLTPTKSS